MFIVLCMFTKNQAVQKVFREQWLANNKKSQPQTFPTMTLVILLGHFVTDARNRSNWEQKIILGDLAVLLLPTCNEDLNSNRKGALITFLWTNMSLCL